MDDNSITALMLRDHEKIVDNLNKVEEKGYPSIEAFLKFKWHLEKHIFVEEKAIFTSYLQKGDSKEEDVFSRLSKEHTLIMDLMDKILEESFPRGNTNFNRLKKLLVAHKKFEEDEVYPRLEEKLDEKSKQEIIERITEII